MKNKYLELIIKWEGYRSDAYKCPASVWTIGYGHTNNVKEGDKCSVQQATDWLLEDTSYVVSKIKSWNIPLTDNQFSACVSFFYNLGFLSTSKQINRLLNRDFEEFSNTLPKYCKAGGVELQGLINRRLDEQTLFNKI